MNKKKIFSLIVIVSVACNVILFWNFFSGFQNGSIKDLEEKYPLLSKRVLREVPIDILINFLDLRKSLHSMVDPYGDNFALYFEYLPTGTSIGINSNNEYYVASLFKLPVVMSYYKHKENNHITTDKIVGIRPDEVDPRFGDLWKKGVGYQISLEDAAKIAITDSDNTAVQVLGPYIGEKDFQDVYDAIDIELKISSEGALLSPKNYSSILKSLYFSAVLNRDNSEKILEYLDDSKFNDKLPAGVPENIPVAHKIGVIDGQSYLDCGIVYAPRRPYLLCMVSKSDEVTARDRMKKVSKAVYDFVSTTGK